MYDPADIAAGKVAGGAARGERWSWSEVVPGNTTVQVFRYRHGLKPQARLVLSVTGGRAIVTVIRRFDRSAHHMIFHLGPGYEEVIPVGGAAAVDLASDPDGCTYNATIYPEDYEGFGHVDDTWTGLAGAVGVPGPWTVAPVLGGFPPPRRTRAMLYTGDPAELVPGIALQARLRDQAGTTVAFWTVTNPVEFTHPPRLQLALRHPGGVDPRGAAIVYRRG